MNRFQMLRNRKASSQSVKNIWRQGSGNSVESENEIMQDWLNCFENLPETKRKVIRRDHGPK
jgi:hypothetical protein